MEFETTTTSRLILRKLTPEVISFVFDNYTDEELMRFFGLNTAEALAKEKQKYTGGLRTHNRSLLYFQLIDKTTGEVIGWCGFHTWYLDHSRAEIGYILTNDAYKGKGIMTEALAPIVAYGFNVMQLERIEAFVGPNNEASLKLVGKLNFVQEGHLKKHYFKDNKLEDSLVFALLKSDYHTD